MVWGICWCYIRDYWGNVEEANIILGLMAVTSKGAGVAHNLNFAIKAYYQHKNGEPIKSGRFPNTSQEQLAGILNGELTIEDLGNLLKDLKLIPF